MGLSPSHPPPGATVNAFVGTDRHAAPVPRLREDLPLLAVVLLVAILGRLPALGAWWTMDDWGLIAQAAGLDAAPAGLPARWLSQHLWWAVTWPLFGLNSDAQAVLRLVLHALSAALVLRIGARLKLGTGGRLLAGLLFASSPLVFTNLYWAAGIQETLAVVCSLAAVERWLSRDRFAVPTAAAWAVASLLAKETGLGLPLFFGALLAIRARRERVAAAPAIWLVILFLSLVAVVETVQVMRHFATGPGDPYQLGGPVRIVTNLGMFGWWLMSPGPVLAGNLSVPMVGAGWLLFVLWAAWAVRAWRRDDGRPAALLLACVLALAPALPLHHHLKPYLATPAGVLALGVMVPRRWQPRPVVMAALVVVALVWSFGGMRLRLANRNELGFPADPVVRATSLSWQATRLIRDLPWPPGSDEAKRELVLLQVPVAAESRRDAARLGERWITESELYRALGGTRGPALMAGDDVHVSWVNALTAAPATALVLCEDGEGLKVWGLLPQATLYAALTDVGLGDFSRARAHLVRAAAEHDKTISFAWDEGLMIIPLKMVLDNKEAFVDWTVARLRDGESSLHEVGGVQDLFLHLLEGATGRRREDLIAGGTYIVGPDATAADSLITGPEAGGGSP